MRRGQQNTSLRMAERLWMEGVGVDRGGVPSQHRLLPIGMTEDVERWFATRCKLSVILSCRAADKDYPPRGLFQALPGGFFW